MAEPIWCAVRWRKRKPMSWRKSGSIFSTAILTFVYEFFGLAAGADGLTDYSVLTDAAIRDPIITYSILIALVASLISAAPFIFCNMTKEKHAKIIEELQKKAENEE